MKKLIIAAIMAAFTMAPTPMVGQETQAAPEMDAPTTVEMVASEMSATVEDAPEVVATKKEHGKKYEPITWWCGRCGAGYGDSIPRGECPTCKDIPVITCECGFQYYAIDIDGNPSVCPECEMREWEAQQSIKVVDQEIEKPTEVVVDEVVAPEEEPEPEMDEYDKAIADGDYCEAREHYNDNGKHSTGNGCKYEEMHPDECESEE